MSRAEFHRVAAAPATAAALALALVTGCSLYVPDEDVSRADIIVLTAEMPDPDASNGGYIADGQQSFKLLIDVDAETSVTKDIQVTTSDGIVNFSVAPDDAAARTVTVRVAPGSDEEDGARKLVEVPMVVGRNPGNVFVSATVEGVQHQVTLELATATPDAVILQTNLTALALDGVARAELSATLLRDSGQVSLGTRVAWRACCVGDQQTLMACPGRTPLQIPGLTELQTGDSVATTAVSERMTAAEFGGDASPFDVLVIAQPVTGSDEQAQCTGAVADADAISIQVTPQS